MKHPSPGTADKSSSSLGLATVGFTAALSKGAILGSTAPAAATKPMIGWSKRGCVIHGRLRPYANEKLDAIESVPLWIRRSGGAKLEGMEIVVRWRGYFNTWKSLPRFVIPKNAARWELVGPCDRSRLAAPSIEPESGASIEGTPEEDRLKPSR